jgi:hypothetical protein
MQFRTFIDDSTPQGSQTISGISTQGSGYGVGISSDISCRNLEIINSGIETINVSSSVLNGSVNIDVLSGNLFFYTSNASGNFSFNIRGNSSSTLNSFLSIGKVLTITILTTQGSPAYYASSFSIDGVTVTPKWMGGTTPSSGFSNSINAYNYVIIKTASNTYTVLASLNRTT